MKSNARMEYCALAVAGLSLLLGSVATAAPTGKIEICHKAGERNQRILSINEEKDGEKHFGHGDYVIAPEVCDGLDSDCEKPPVADNDVDCSDGIACTVDSCAGVAGCFHDPVDALCNDDNPTTLDVCSVDYGGCIYTQLNQAPVIPSDQVFNVNENSPNGTVVGTVIAFDPDQQDILTYAITGSDFTPFTINSNTGMITVIDGTLLDYETQTSFIIQVTVTDTGNLSDTENITINVIDLPDSCPCSEQWATETQGWNTFVQSTDAPAYLASVLLPTAFTFNTSIGFDLRAQCGYRNSPDSFNYSEAIYSVYGPDSEFGAACKTSVVVSSSGTIIDNRATTPLTTPLLVDACEIELRSMCQQ